MKKTSRMGRRAFALGLFGAAAGAALLFGGRTAGAQTYYSATGAVIVVNPATLTAPMTVYNAYGQPVVIYPTRPAYVPAPIYGPTGIVGQSRRVARRTARRVSRRR